MDEEHWTNQAASTDPLLSLEEMADLMRRAREEWVAKIEVAEDMAEWLRQNLSEQILPGIEIIVNPWMTRRCFLTRNAQGEALDFYMHKEDRNILVLDMRSSAVERRMWGK